MAPKIPVTDPSATLREKQNQETLHPTAVEVQYEPGSRLISLEIELGQSGSRVVPLSPPAAKQLSRALRKAVKDYLNGAGTE